MYKNTRTRGGNRFGSKKKYSQRSRSSGSGQGGYNSRRNRGGNRYKKNTKNRLDVSKFIQKAVPISEGSAHKIRHTFADFSFCKKLQQNLTRKNYVTPTPVQDQAIPLILKGKDVVGVAQTGTGKTAAFLLPLINKIFNDRSQKVLIIAPTRELAEQIDTEFRQFSYEMRIFSTLCIGGNPIYKQINQLKRRPDVVIGTPGRLKDLSKRGILKFGIFNNVVIDEIDRMLDMGFINEIKDILSGTNSNRQTLCFTATLPESIKRLVHQFLKQPVMVKIESAKTAQHIDQDIVRVTDISLKFTMLEEILLKPGLEKVLIFNETKRDVEKLAQDLMRKGFKVQSIHGDKRQRERRRSLRHFRENKINILVATEVASRGLDIKNVTHVINYTVPRTYDDYIHRIGRTGRANQTGTALTFV